jgi:pyruvate formate lyase activating enzyme
MKKIAELWESLDQQKVRCHVCAHYCIISPGKRGFCNTRENIDGTLYTLVYGAGIHKGSNDPVEKKPLYHFWPGSTAFSIATIGCNFRCKHCQNWEISQAFPTEDGKKGDFSEEDRKKHHAFNLTELTPEAVVSRADQLEAKSIAYTYNEPTIWFEFVKETSLLAHKKGIQNILVTNGYSSTESNAEFVKFIDATNIDIKGFSNDFYKRIVGIPKLQPVLDTAIYFKQQGVHVEITNLLIPNENDDPKEIKELAIWVRDNLGWDTPLHFSAYFPRYRLDQPPTPPDTLINAWSLAKDLGLHYVYMGNMRSSEGSSTYCYKCGAELIERVGYTTQARNLTSDNHCKKCGEKASIIGACSESLRSYTFL